MEKIDYRPKHVVFVLPEDSVLPKSLGKIKDLSKCQELIGKSCVVTNQKYTARREMDAYEKAETRRKYQEELEQRQPELEKALSEAAQKLDEAKTAYSEAQKMYAASELKVKDLAKQVRIGEKDINLDQASTWRLPLNGSYYYLTYMDGELLVADIRQIPDYEKSDIFNSQAKNEESIESLLKSIKKPNE